MNTGQMIMALGAMLLLSVIVLRVNTANLLNESVRDDSQYSVLATSIATSIIEEAQSKAFDEKTDTTSVTSLDQLTSDLGPEFGETEFTFDDFDDYNGFTKRDSTMPSSVFDIYCTVDYVSKDDVRGVSEERTWNKKIKVTITRPVTADSSAIVLRASSIFSYWYFR